MVAGVLGQVEAGLDAAEAPVGGQAFGHAPDADGAGTAADSLHVVVRHLADRGHRVEEEGADAVAPGHVLDPALQLEADPGGRLGGHLDGVVVVTTSDAHHRGRGGGVLSRSPDPVDVGLSGHHDHGKADPGPQVGERPAGVPRGGHDDPGRAGLDQALQGRGHLQVLERAGRTAGTPFRPPPVERHPQVIEAEERPERLAAEGAAPDRLDAGRGDRQPVGESPQALQVVADLETGVLGHQHPVRAAVGQVVATRGMAAVAPVADQHVRRHLHRWSVYLSGVTAVRLH